MKDKAEVLTNIEVLDPETPIAAYNPIKAGIEKLSEKYSKTVFSVATTKELEFAKAARAEVREVRYNVEHTRKALKAPAIAYASRIDAEAKQYTESLLAIENPIDELIKAEEKRKAEEKAERERIEEEERQAVQAVIDEIKNNAIYSVGLSSEEIGAAITALSLVEVTLETFGDRAGEAEMAKRDTLATLADMQTAAQAQEAERERLRVERETLERERVEQEAKALELRQAEDARIAAEKAELAEKQAKLDAEQAKERARQKEVQDKLDAERKAFEDEKAAAAKAKADAAAKAEREEQDKRDEAARIEKEKAETLRLEQEAKEKADADKKRFRARKEFLAKGPGDAAMVQVIADFYVVPVINVITWLRAVDLDALTKETEKETA